MTAQEMFEELGFNMCVDDGIHLLYRIKQDKKGKDNDPFNWNYIDFYYKDKTYSVDIMIGEIDIKLHKAIHQQLIELGWIK